MNNIFVIKLYQNHDYIIYNKTHYNWFDNLQNGYKLNNWAINNGYDNHLRLNNPDYIEILRYEK